MASDSETVERLNAALAGRYRIEREVGSGGMATVYLAQDLKHNRQVAVKVLDPGLAQSLGSERFLLEIQTVANLTHPHILPLHDSGEADGFLFYVMPYVKGDTLATRLKEDGQLPIGDALQITREIASALTYAHEEGVIHRDVKPANIMFEAGHAVLADFGVAHAVAKAEDERITKTGTSLGTPIYTSPEQVIGDKDLDGRSDQYSLACVLFEMLAGRPPFEGESGRSLLHQHLAVDAPGIEEFRSGTPLSVAAGLRRALGKEPSGRFSTPNEFYEALEAASGGLAARLGGIRRPLSRQLPAGLGTAVVLAMVVLGTRQWWAGPSDPVSPPPDRPYTVLATVAGSADSGTRETVEFLLRSALDVAHVVQTVPQTETQRVLGLMERREGTPLDPATAREVAQRLGVNTIVDARLGALGNSWTLAIRVEEVESERLVAEASGQAIDATVLVETVDAVAVELRRGLGETRSVLANNEPLPEVLTPSLDALHKYREGLLHFRNFRPGQAVPLFREALALDPQFSAAHVELSAAYHNAGISDSVVVHLRRALETPERLTEVQRRDTEAYLKYASDFALWDETMFRTGYRNRDALRLTDFQHADSAWTLMMSEVEEVVRRTRRFDPDARLSTEDDNRWRNAIRLAIVTGHLDELEAFVDSLRMETGEYWELMKSFDSGDWERADSLRGAAPDIWDTHVNKRMAVTALDALRGRIGESVDSWASIPSRRLHPARVQLIFELVYGAPPASAPAALRDRGLDAIERYIVHGVRSAILGDTVESKRVSARLEAARDSATSDLFESAFRPMFALLDAGVASRRSDWSEVRMLLEPIADRLAEPGFGFISDRFLVRWILAEAYSQLRETGSSIAQLEALLAERSFEPLHVLLHAPAHFRLAGLNAEVGNTEKAREHYSAFLEAFSDPDPEYEWMVEEARSSLGG